MSIVAIGPYSKNHGEAKMFQHSCSVLKEKFDVIIIDSSRPNFKYLRPWYVIISLCYFSYQKKVSFIYLSYSRNKYMLAVFLPFLLFICLLTKPKCIFHIHDTSLKKNVIGLLGNFVKKLYSKCIDVTILPNASLEQYCRIEEVSKLKFVPNPYLGNS